MPESQRARRPPVPGSGLLVHRSTITKSSPRPWNKIPKYDFWGFDEFKAAEAAKLARQNAPTVPTLLDPQLTDPRSCELNDGELLGDSSTQPTQTELRQPFASETGWDGIDVPVDNLDVMCSAKASRSLQGSSMMAMPGLE
eukprot:CAMPEP_0115875864 /NCGR_PEP_ID=MMETSP0287-20121206/25339_1 /TAXON_ID=412157 /ORGANISM="Chrysochromulina rotalis, Strain UIO044" /LENGTH=140 /DNA_ID=CAMNT_0003331185 /DNA_START=36 /DNA_END=458 /DNA_ORIENTATION=-